MAATIYYILSSSLVKNDRKLILKLSQNYVQIVESFGVQQLQKSASEEVFILILNKDKEVIYSHIPTYIDEEFSEVKELDNYDDEDEISALMTELKALPLSSGWNYVIKSEGEDKDVFDIIENHLAKYALNNWLSILPLVENDLVEVYTRPLSDDRWIHVAKSSESREEYLASVRYTSIAVVIPFILLGVLLSYLLSRTILTPLRNLTHTIQNIQDGEVGLRAKNHGRDDEVDELAGKFNSLLDQNSKLLENLKHTLDNIAHDMRTPLTRFRIEAERALSKEDDLQSVKEALLNGLENVEHLTALLNAIMDASEAEVSSMKMKKETIEVFHLIEGIKDLFQYTAEEKNILIQTEVASGIFVSGDLTRLSQAFSNLLDNAIKYSYKDSIVKISTQVQGETLRVLIEDQGMGIDEKDIDRIWDRLYRADLSRTTHGLGIGLSVVKAIIKAHGGTVDVQSVVGEGSTFIVTLPICNDPV